MRKPGCDPSARMDTPLLPFPLHANLPPFIFNLSNCPAGVGKEPAFVNNPPKSNCISDGAQKRPTFASPTVTTISLCHVPSFLLPPYRAQTSFTLRLSSAVSPLSAGLPAPTLASILEIAEVRPSKKGGKPEKNCRQQGRPNYPHEWGPPGFQVNARARCGRDGETRALTVAPVPGDVGGRSSGHQSLRSPGGESRGPQPRSEAILCHRLARPLPLWPEYTPFRWGRRSCTQKPLCPRRPPGPGPGHSAPRLPGRGCLFSLAPRF